MAWRKYHRIVSLFILLPFSVTLVTGLILQLRNELELIQPKSVMMKKIEGVPLLSLEKIIKLSSHQPEDMDQVIFKPKKFHLALRLKDGTEIQMHPQTGEILKKAKRATGLLIDLHQGSFFTSWAQSFIFLPAGLGVLFLMISGLIIYPRRKRRE